MEIPVRGSAGNRQVITWVCLLVYEPREAHLRAGAVKEEGLAEETLGEKEFSYYIFGKVVA